MENIAFTEIISFDESKKFKRINETEAVEYFLNCNDDNLKKLFLDKFVIYIEKGLETKEFTNNTMKDLMFIIYYLYDDPFSLLVCFSDLIEEINFNVLKLHTCAVSKNIAASSDERRYFSIMANIIAGTEKSRNSNNSELTVELKNKLIAYRNDVEFMIRKNDFLEEYGKIDDEELKQAFEKYIDEEYHEDGIRRINYGFFDYNFGNQDRYYTYRHAYTYSLKKYGNEKTKKLFKPRGDDLFFKLMLESGKNKIPNLKRAFFTTGLIYGLKLIRHYGDLAHSLGPMIEDYDLRKLFNEASNSLLRDFKGINIDSSEIEKKNIQAIIEEVNFPEFLESNAKSIKYYCSKKGIDISLFNIALGYLKDEALLKQIEEKKQQLSSTRYAVLNSKIDKMIDYIMNGVPMDNETTREFDYLDYKLMTKLEFDDFKKLACDNGNANADIVRAVSIFIGKNKNVRKTNIQSILNAKNIVGYGTDNEHEITDEEKLATIEYLKQHHLVSKNGVIDSKVYNIAIKRYLAGTLFTEEDKDKIKNKS